MSEKMRTRLATIKKIGQGGGEGRTLDCFVEMSVADGVPPLGEADEDLRSAGIDPVQLGQSLRERIVGARADLEKSKSRLATIEDSIKADSLLKTPVAVQIERGDGVSEIIKKIKTTSPANKSKPQPIKIKTVVSEPRIKSQHEKRIKTDDDIDEMDLVGNRSEIVSFGVNIGTMSSMIPSLTEFEYNNWLESFGYKKTERTSQYHETFLFKKEGWPDMNLDVKSNPLKVIVNHFETTINLPLISEEELEAAKRRLIEVINFTDNFVRKENEIDVELREFLVETVPDQAYTKVGTVSSLVPQISESEHEKWLESFGYKRIKRTSKQSETFLFKKRGWPDINLSLISNPSEVLMNFFEAVVCLPLISDEELDNAQRKLVELVEFTKNFKTITSVHNE